MLPNLDELRSNYERYDDAKLIRIATEEAASLRPEALDLIKQIIKERGLSQDVLDGVDAQLKPLDEAGLAYYTDLLRSQHCPLCKTNFAPLNATLITSVMSFLVLTHRKTELVIGCPTCLEKKHTNALLKTAILGWWGLPWGLIRTPQALINNAKYKKLIHLDEANGILRGYALNNIGRIEANKNSPEGLQNIITHIR